ncbi:hypothetical protein TWF730_009031 [Orbilia blumenaviensis]|uniref:Uncharacterized protein n=1 Tax=Orbilia blumenaviensis TaxID=1796055 RepID=A0AAV9V3R0_9PEZI
MEPTLEDVGELREPALFCDWSANLSEQVRAEVHRRFYDGEPASPLSFRGQSSGAGDGKLREFSDGARA